MLSVIVVVYNMQREAPRTLYTLTARYQRGVADNDYEVIVVDNGSTHPLTADLVGSFGSNFRYLMLGDVADPSPCKAINYAVERARGDLVGVMIDGARMASPGLIRYAMDALCLYEHGVVATLSWHLGPKPQSLSITEGYCQDVEDRLLGTIDWCENGYSLFNISAFAWSSINGYFRNISESNAIFMRRAFFEKLQGFDEQFRLPGGGLANLDFYKRACEYQDSNAIVLLGEGTFHQVHGGIATNSTNGNYVESAYREYHAIRGREFAAPTNSHILFGRPTREALPWIASSATNAAEFK
jgi:glycosyltransferase involved in cell wall biosynthesis